MRSRPSAAVLVTVVCAASWAAAAPPPDALITSNTKLLLWTTAGVKSTAVHVDTTEGVVSLYGKVPTGAQRDLAAKTASDVPGVRDVRNLLQVVPARDEPATARSDGDIKLAVEQQLKGPGLAASGISVRLVDKGVVLLGGEARSFGDCVRALARTGSVPGVRRIVSEVKTPGNFREDERATFSSDARAAIDIKAAEAKMLASDVRITTDVKLRLWTSPQVSSLDINVDTVDGVVTLFGIVPTPAVKSAAGAEADKIFGVHKLNNELEVVSTAARPAVEAKDVDISRDVALASENRMAMKNVTASVKNGTVRLAGTVPTGWDALDVVRIVRRVTGVHGVVNELTIDDPKRRD